MADGLQGAVWLFPHHFTFGVFRWVPLKNNEAMRTFEKLVGYLW